MTTFISYSRDNAEFVVRLARDLKTAGFDVWLDQLDIPKGARWDDAIEAAVVNSSSFMIVISSESIQSQNVKDELSYAIDAGKHILPVLISPCKIPLRLRRFQYVDFTHKPYKESLADIKQLLSNTKRLVKTPPEELIYEQPESAPVFEAPLVERAVESPPEPVTKNDPKEVRSLRKFIAPLILAVILMAAIIAGLAFAENRNTPPPPITFTSIPPTITSTTTITSTPIPPPQQIIDSAGVTMRFVSAGDFIMGSDSGMADERPVQTVYLDTFYIDKYEITNALYKACVNAGACQAPKKVNSITRVSYYSKADFDNYPVVYVDWNMARKYCEWRGARLPTEAEWEKAARGTEGRTYPWGEDISCQEANYFGCKGDTNPVFDYDSGRSVYGVYNMSGNVYEWVSSLYMPYPYDLADGREDLNASGERVVRGGSWLNSDSDNEARSARRQKADPSTSGENIGFRCVLGSDSLAMNTTLTTSTPQNSYTATSQAATRRSNKTREPGETDAANLVASPVPLSIAATSGGAALRPTAETVVLPTEPPVITEPPVEPPTEPPVEPTDPPVEPPPPTDPPVEPPPPTDPPAEPPPPTDSPAEP